MVCFPVEVDDDTYEPLPTHCNALGLSPLGETAIRLLMDAKMIIDVDHMSTAMRETVLARAEARRYAGIVSGHTGFTELYKGHKKSEGQLTAREVDRIIALRGMVAPILNQGSRDEMVAHRTSTGKIHDANDCGNSAKSFAAAYLYAVSRSGGRGVGFGSDINGLAGLPTPRFGPYRCGGDGQPNREQPVTYPVPLYPGMGPPMDRMQAGTRVFDINFDGYANVGMFPDFIAELRAVGLTDEDLEPLFSSAEAYISMWEYTEDPSRPDCAR